ncbi:putative tRNA pseudouridine synthase Pus10, partial [Cladochytrium tenue]
MSPSPVAALTAAVATATPPWQQLLRALAGGIGTSATGATGNGDVGGALPCEAAAAAVLARDVRCCVRCAVRLSVAAPSGRDARAALRAAAAAPTLLTRDSFLEHPGGSGVRPFPSLADAAASELAVAASAATSSTASSTTSPAVVGTAAAAAVAKETDEPVCPTCLGLLQRPLDPISSAAGRQLAERGGYGGAQAAIVSVRVPVQLAVRQWAALRAVERRLADAGLAFKAAAPTERVWYRGGGGGGAGAVGEGTSSKTEEEGKESKPAASPAGSGGVAADAVPGESIVDVKDVLKVLLTDEFERQLGVRFDAEAPLAFEIGFDHAETEEDYVFMTKIEKAGFDLRRKRHRDGTVRYEGNSWNRVVMAAAKMEYEDFKAAGLIPLPVPREHCSIREFNFHHAPVYVAGRYNKYQRGVSHSRWLVKGGSRAYAESVEELVGLPLDAFVGAEAHKFASAGREDADVRMLGDGRPFYFELTNPRRPTATPEEVAALQARINEAVEGKVR